MGKIKIKQVRSKIDRPGRQKRTLEALGLLIIAILSIFLKSRGTDSYYIFPTLGTLALGAQRLLPALQQLYRAWASIRSNAAAVVLPRILVTLTIFGAAISYDTCLLYTSDAADE